MKTPRRSSKVVTDTAPVTGIPVSDAKALFDAVSQDNTKHITLGVPTEVVRQAPIQMLGESDVSDRVPGINQLPEGVASVVLDQEPGELPEGVARTLLEAELPELPAKDLDIERIVEQALEKAGLPTDATTGQLLEQALTQMEAANGEMTDLIDRGVAIMEQLMAGIDTDTNGPAIPGTIEMDIEQDDGSVNHRVFDNPDRILHVTAMAQCDELIRQLDAEAVARAAKPAVKPLRMGFFSWL